MSAHEWQESWWEALQRDEASARQEWERSIRAPLVRFCSGYLGSTDLAEDAVQDVFCKLLSAKKRPQELRPWVYRVARNHCLNLRRSQARRRDQRRLPTAFEIPASWTGALTRLARSEDHRDVAARLAEVPTDRREPLLLRYVEGLSRAEIAAVLDLPVSVVKSRLYEALVLLRQE